MVRVVAEKIVREEHLEAFLELAKELVVATRKEEGCISYAFHQDEKNPCHFAYIETWETRDHLEAHFNTEHFKRLVPLLGDLSEEQPVHIYNEII